MYYRECLENYLVGEKKLKKARKRYGSEASAKSMKRFKAVFSSQRSFMRQINFLKIIRSVRTKQTRAGYK